MGFLGAGLIAQAHVRLLGAVPEVTIAAVHDPAVDRARAFAAATGAAPCATVAEVIDRSEALYVCTWTSEHPQAVRAAAERGLAVFCEKPLGVDLASVETMVAAVDAAAVTNQVGLVLRYSPAFHWLRRLIDDPRSGRMISVGFRDDQYLPVGGGYGSTWRSDAARAGSGVLLEHSIHDLDMLEHLAGPMERVSCVTRALHGLSGIEDVAVLSFQSRGGAVGALTTVWHDIRDRGDSRRVEVFCENLWGALDGHFHDGPVAWERRGEPRQTLQGQALRDRAREVGLVEQNEDAAFVAAVLGGRPASPDFRTGLRAHQVVDVAYRSAAAGGRQLDVPATA